MENIQTGIDDKIKEMGARIRELRELEHLTVSEMAAAVGLSEAEYQDCEAGRHDMNFTIIYRCAGILKVDVTELIEGDAPRLRSYDLTRAGAGQRVSQAHGMTYYNMADAFQNRIAEPLYVRCHYDPQAELKPIEVTSHAGQECDIVVDGYLKVQIGAHQEVLGPGDSIYYNSRTPHGMIAVSGKDCIFYAIVLNPEGEPIPELNMPVTVEESAPAKRDTESRIYRNFIDVTENEKGVPTSITFKNTEHFNFAFDIVDAIAEKDKNKLAMVYVSEKDEEKKFTFHDMYHESARCANYFTSIGIKKGDRVILSLKRHYQFWFAMLGLNKIGAIAIPATSQLLAHDFSYRFRKAGVSAVICSADGDIAEQVEIAEQTYEKPLIKMLVNGEREGWRDFNTEYAMYSSHFARKENSPGGDDTMLMFFTSGTSGYPKLTMHNYKYALGHFHTARYWHSVDPDGLHFTISETGWAKALWGKLFGQWISEAATFVYDFDRFDAARILPMIAKYHITTLCAPPTMLRMMIKQDLSKYDFSSVKRVTTAGEALNPEVFRKFKDATGLSIYDGFGQSESTMIIGNLAGAQHKIGSMGKAAPIYDVVLMDKDDHPVEAGEVGEIAIDLSKGSPCGLTTGYYEDAEENAYAFRNGYYHTGDLAWKDEDDFYWYVGRADDVIKSSGYRIGPFEIENVIMELPYVLECGVSAAPDEVRGQVVKASIVLVKGTEPSDALVKEVQEYVKEHTAPYKYPRIVVFKESLPKTASGKIQRNLL